ncbi:Xaa-Pro dipeptidase [Steroidobacter denitrificans]|uniref:Xaa-Pro dipeptidase n=1 Tax=Steroidobacter denitrificans TaxID=465721 RepID=A0A127F7Z3_STEDE|nr:Xaa-Pro dipeptidase [Steroidobacter denitrificans]AMN46544.1 Xaa-Pro dipeptidase [Steroidobacter denitrificans]
MLSSLFDDHIRIQRRRTDAALAACGFEALAIYAGGPHMRFLDDQPYPFQPNPHFKLWAPLADAEDCWIIYRPARPLRLIFLQPLDYWHQPPAMPQGHWTGHFDFEVIRTRTQAKDHFAGIRHCAFIGEWRMEFAAWGFTAVNPDDLLDRLHYPRAIKTAYELECLRRASLRAACGHRAAEARFRAGGSEYDIHISYLQATAHTDSELPYPNIVALNGNASILHYQNQERQRPASLHSFLLDAGAQVHGYAADVTRTYSGQQDDFAQLIDSMHVLQRALCAQVRAGADYTDIHLDMHLRIAGLLREADLISVSATQAVESGLSSVFIPHGAGHLLGLQVHDVAGLQISAEGRRKPPPDAHPYLRLTRILEPGFVVTIEPGLYFIELLLKEARAGARGRDINWPRVEQFRSFGGIRIEDNIACTTGEPENLTRQAFEATPAAH